MDNKDIKFGLVLAGGGAKGAYQAGALRYLAEIGFVPHVIAGTSIGALNGAVLASYQPFPTAVHELNLFWNEIGEANILRIHRGLIGAITAKTVGYFLSQYSDWVNTFLRMQGMLRSPDSIFDIAPVDHLLRKIVKPSDIRQGIEVWATVFPSLHIPKIEYDWLISATLDFSRAFMGVKSEWLRIQDCQDDEAIYKLLLASAAIPLVFPKQEIEGQPYVDGGLADNIPFGALARQGCTHVIVIHLSNGNIWNRHNFPEQTIIEIRPEQPMMTSDIPVAGLVKSIIDFSPERIAELKENGYNDARRCVENIRDVIGIIKEERQARKRIEASTVRLTNDLPLI